MNMPKEAPVIVPEIVDKTKPWGMNRGYASFFKIPKKWMEARMRKIYPVLSFTRDGGRLVVHVALPISKNE